MKTTSIADNKGKANSTAASNKTEKENLNGMPVSSAFEEKVEKKDKADKTHEQKAEGKTDQIQTGNAKAEPQKVGAGQPNAEPTKTEIKEKLAEEKPALNLEQTLKKIKDLGRLSNQRDKLIETTDTLDAFEIAQMDEAEETNLNHFQGCTLIIKDDKGKEFVTKNPFIIDKTANQIKTLCYDKLAEVEAQISLTL